MRRISARREHRRVSDPEVCGLLEALVPLMKPDGYFWPGTQRDFRRCHDALVEFFNITPRDGIGITPASHRPGVTTQCYLDDWPFDKIAWHGGWMSRRTLEIYIQEVASLQLIANMSVVDRERVDRFASVAHEIVSETTQKLLTWRNHGTMQKGAP